MKRVIVARQGILAPRRQPVDEFVGEPYIDPKIMRKPTPDWKEKLALVTDLIADYDCRISGRSPLGCTLTCGEQDGDEIFQVHISFDGSIDDVENQVLDLLDS